MSYDPHTHLSYTSDQEDNLDVTWNNFYLPITATTKQDDYC